jgi:hypothetical protein
MKWNPINVRDPTGMIGFDANRFVDNFASATYRPSYRCQNGNLSKWITLTYEDGTSLDLNLDDIAQMSVDVRLAISSFDIYEGNAGRQFPLEFNEVSTPNIFAAAEGARKAMNQYAFECLVDASVVIVLPIVMGPELGAGREISALKFSSGERPRGSVQSRSVGADWDPDAELGLKPSRARKPIRLSKNWRARSIDDPKCVSGCENVARQIKKLIGGDIRTITSRANPGGQIIGAYRGRNLKWYHHEVVVKDGRVYDAFTGHKGLTIDEYKRLWEYADGLDFGF